jgi:5-methylcytosine-specific restriction endonuclease McrA
VVRLCKRCRTLIPSEQWERHRSSCYVAHRVDERPKHSSSAAWKKLRLAILKRDGFMCQWSGCTEPAADVHHLGGNWRNDSPANLISVCRRHHPAPPSFR